MSKVRSIGGNVVEVRITDCGTNRPAVIEIVRQTLRVAPAEAAEIVAGAPVTLGTFPQRIAERLTNELQDAGATVALPGTETLEEFLSLLDRCREQVERDPSGYFRNPHLYPLLHKIYLRLCHGKVPGQA